MRVFARLKSVSGKTVHHIFSPIPLVVTSHPLDPKEVSRCACHITEWPFLQSSPKGVDSKMPGVFYNSLGGSLTSNIRPAGLLRPSRTKTRPSGDGVRRPAVNGVSLCSHIRHTQSGETLAGAIKMAADKVIHIYPRIAAAPRESLVTSQASTAAAPSLPSNTLVTGSSTANMRPASPLRPPRRTQGPAAMVCGGPPLTASASAHTSAIHNQVTPRSRAIKMAADEVVH